MKISEMLTREDFYPICEKTLQRYYFNVYKLDVEVKITSPKLNSDMFVYPKLGVIITRFPSLKVVCYILNEFNIKDNFFKKIAAKTYVLLCLCTGGIFARKGLSFDNKTIVNKDILILPSNRKLRIYNFREGFVDAILKENFTDKYLKRELEFREKYKLSFVLPYLKVGNDWYREEILSGKPLARITNEKQYTQSEKEAAIYINQIAEQTLVYQNAKEYADELNSFIAENIERLKKKKKIVLYDETKRFAKNLYNFASSMPQKVPTALTHGDLQSGNIWVDEKKKKTYIIDFETVQTRSVWFDIITLYFHTRRGKISELCQRIDQENVKRKILSKDWQKGYDIRQVLAFFMLENIIFFIDDILELNGDEGGYIFDYYLKEMLICENLFNEKGIIGWQ
jgi:thiamine kinase-like enzyme